MKNIVFQDKKIDSVLKIVGIDKIVLNVNPNNLSSGERKMLSIKRPGTGIAPNDIEKIIGKKVNRNLSANSVLKWDYLK